MSCCSANRRRQASGGADTGTSTMGLEAGNRRVLRQALDELAGRSTRYLANWHVHRDLRLACRDAPVWLLVAPGAFLIIQAGLVLNRRPALTWPLWIWLVLALLGPVLVVAGRMAWLRARRRIPRRIALAVFDRQLDTRDRLVTADDFLASSHSAHSEQTRTFIEAAIDDAVPLVDTALQTPLAPRGLPDWDLSVRGYAAVPAAALVLWMAMSMGSLRGGAGPLDAQGGVIAARVDAAPARIASKRLDLRFPVPRLFPRAPDTPPDGDRPRTASAVSGRVDRSENQAPGQSRSGGQANSRSSNDAGGGSGTPANQRTPSTVRGEDDSQQAQKTPSPDQARKPDGRRGEQQAAAATSGQSQSTSSSSATTNISSHDQPDRAGRQKEEGGDEAGIEDEAEEEKTSGVERPALRRNRPAVNRNLSPDPTRDDNPAAANGRSGPSGRKKSRGVPAMILGVPIPDRIPGMRNPGRSKVTQENSAPSEERHPPLNAEGRRAREQPFGHIEHPLLLPRMQRLIENYFMQLRNTKGSQ